MESRSTEVAQIFAAGRLAFPKVTTSEDAIRTVLGTRHIELRFPADLFLASAALVGDDAALREVDRLLADVRGALHGVVRDHEIDELVQDLRVRSVVGSEGRAPALAGYAGRGPLRVWLRVSLLRAGLDARRRVAPAQIDEAAWLALPDPTIVAPAEGELRRLTTRRIRATVERAITELPKRDRLILRQHLIDGLAPPELATLYGVHRVTAFRWLATIRQRVLAEVRADLGRELGLSTSALDSLLREVRGSLVPTVERVLILTPEPR
jgi:RNA polymerase sigma-70 factor, ECF subfamily